MPFPGISWLKGNAECLPLQDDSFDAYTIAFGIRNTTHVDKVRVNFTSELSFRKSQNVLFLWQYHVHSFDKAHTPKGTYAKILVFLFL